MTDAGDTGRYCFHIAWGDMVHVLGRCSLILVAIQTVGRVGTIGDDIGNRSPGRVNRIDVTGGVMALAAIVLVIAQDIGPVAGQMAVGAFLAIRLTEVGERIDIYRMIDCATGKAVIMARKVGAVAVLAFTAMNIRRLLQGRTDANPAYRIMAGDATTIMDFASTAKR